MGEEEEKLGEMEAKVEDMEMVVQATSDENELLHERLDELTSRNSGLGQGVKSPWRIPGGNKNTRSPCGSRSRSFLSVFSFAQRSGLCSSCDRFANTNSTQLSLAPGGNGNFTWHALLTGRTRHTSRICFKTTS